MTPRIHALVPLKDLEAAKTRLAEVLLPAPRRELVRAMAVDVLAVLVRHPAVATVQVLSDAPEVAALAQAAGAVHWREADLLAGWASRGEAGAAGLSPAAAGRARDPLNRVLDAAAGRLAPGAGPDALTLVLHADLPCLGRGDIDAALAAWEQGRGIVLGCDAQGSGSNLLLFEASRPPVFLFGPGSAEAHRRWAEERKIPFQCLHLPGVASDIDTPEDLRALARLAPGPRTRRWLTQQDKGSETA